jgi:hypothetical protein
MGDIKVWHDAWLRDEENSFVRSPMILGKKDMYLSDLIEEGGKEWRTNLICK